MCVTAIGRLTIRPSRKDSSCELSLSAQFTIPSSLSGIHRERTTKPEKAYTNPSVWLSCSKSSIISMLVRVVSSTVIGGFLQDRDAESSVAYLRTTVLCVKNIVQAIFKPDLRFQYHYPPTSPPCYNVFTIRAVPATLDINQSLSNSPPGTNEFPRSYKRWATQGKRRAKTSPVQP